MFRSSKLLLAVLIVLVISSVAFAFAASNTMPADTYAGEGASGTLGYTVGTPVYTLNAGTPSNIDKVEFTLSGPATNVKVRLDASSTYYNCTLVAGKWTCATTAPVQLTVGNANEFRVIAVE